jgi:hypothetical protein
VTHGSAAMSATAALTADAEHDLLTGHLGRAVAALAKARAVALRLTTHRAQTHPGYR